MLAITQHQARAFTLARQYLHIPAANPAAVFARLVAVQSQYAASVPAAVWARFPGLEPGWVEAALLDTHALVKTWTLRWTLHALLSSDLPLLVSALARQYEDGFVRFLGRRRSVDRPTYERNNALIRAALAGGPLSRSELHARIPELKSVGPAAWGVDIKGLAFRGEVVVADGSGRDPVFTLRQNWLPELDWQDRPGELEAQQELLRRYLSGYGPARLKDFAHWAGLTVRQAQAIAAGIQAELLPVQVEDWPGTHYILHPDEAGLRSAGDPAPLCLLPKFDVLLVSYARPLRFVRPEDYKRVYGSAGQIEAVVLLDGLAAATWRIERRGKAAWFRLTPLAPIEPARMTAVAGEFERLGTFLGMEAPRLEISA